MEYCATDRPDLRAALGLALADTRCCSGRIRATAVGGPNTLRDAGSSRRNPRAPGLPSREQADWPSRRADARCYLRGARASHRGRPEGESWQPRRGPSRPGRTRVDRAAVLAGPWRRLHGLQSARRPARRSPLAAPGLACYLTSPVPSVTRAARDGNARIPGIASGRGYFVKDEDGYPLSRLPPGYLRRLGD
jgi:hypothetical protein